MPTDLTDRTPAEFLAAAIAVTTAAGANHCNGDEIDGSDGSDTRGSCLYVYKGQPSCYAARILHEMGATVDELLPNEGDRVSGPTFSIPLPASVRESFGQAQYTADIWEPWGAVTSMFLAELEMADAVIPDDLRAQVRELEAQVTTNA